MSYNTNIQWCHSTVNPTMGCSGCELFLYPKVILDEIDKHLLEMFPSYGKNHARRFLNQCVQVYLMAAPDQPTNLTTTNIYHLRNELADEMAKHYGPEAAIHVKQVIEKSMTCYAAKLHLNKAHSIVNPYRQVNSGYAPTFEQITQFPGRVAEMARKTDLLGKSNPDKPWMNGLPRLVFVSDMGDSFSRRADAAFLKADHSHPIAMPESGQC